MLDLGWGLTAKSPEGLPAATVDTEIVLRERGTVWMALLVALAVLAYLLVHDLLHPVHASWAMTAGMAAAAFLVTLVELVVYPPWMTIGPRGIAFGYWFRRWRLTWAQIESFAVGNPADPKYAYVLLRRVEGGGTAASVRLPKLGTHTPAQLVALLQGKQQIFVAARSRSK